MNLSQELAKKNILLEKICHKLKVHHNDEIIETITVLQEEIQGLRAQRIRDAELIWSYRYGRIGPQARAQYGGNNDE